MAKKLVTVLPENLIDKVYILTLFFTVSVIFAPAPLMADDKKNPKCLAPCVTFVVTGIGRVFNKCSVFGWIGLRVNVFLSVTLLDWENSQSFGDKGIRDGGQ